jgi:hypothetical protein
MRIAREEVNKYLKYQYKSLTVYLLTHTFASRSKNGH